MSKQKEKKRKEAPIRAEVNIDREPLKETDIASNDPKLMGLVAQSHLSGIIKPIK
ncbi:MAG: hypothetical protein U9P50_02650 [Patescibacteria group bacterium]|nr:hypothetical protein [Patescibacteria group bacterium]